MEFKYIRYGGCLLPDLGLTEEEQKPIGKYGQMRLDYLKKHRESLFTQLLLSGKLMAHLHEINDTCHARLDLLIPQMKEVEGVTEALKKTDQLEWVRCMNSIHHRIEEICVLAILCVPICGSIWNLLISH